MSLYSVTRVMTLVLRGVNRISPVVKEAAGDIGLIEKAQRKVSDASYRLLFAGVAFSAFAFIAVRSIMSVVAASEAGFFIAKDYENVLKRLGDIMGRHLAPFAAFLVRKLHDLAEAFERHPLIARWVAGLLILAVVIGLVAIPLILLAVGFQFLMGILGGVWGSIMYVVGAFTAATTITGLLATLLGMVLIAAFYALIILLVATAVLAVGLAADIGGLREAFVKLLLGLGFTKEEIEGIQVELIKFGDEIIKLVREFIEWEKETGLTRDMLRNLVRLLPTLIWALNGILRILIFVIDHFRRLWFILGLVTGRIDDTSYALHGGSLDDAFLAVAKAIKILIGWIRDLIDWLASIPRRIVIRIIKFFGGGGDDDPTVPPKSKPGDIHGGASIGPYERGYRPPSDIGLTVTDPYWTSDPLYDPYDPLRDPELLAGGFEGWVTKPTRFIAGEAGPEYLSATPKGKTSPQSITIPIRIEHLNTKADKDELGTFLSRVVANELLRRKSARGIV